MKKIFIFLLPFVLLSCEESTDLTTKDIVYGETISLKFKQSAVDEDESLRVQFSKVIFDACPPNAQCLSWGIRSIELTAIMGDAETKMKLSTTDWLEYVTEFEVGEYTFKLLNIKPEPAEGIDKRISDHKIDILISKAQQ